MTSAAPLATVAAALVVIGLLVAFNAKSDDRPAVEPAAGQVSSPPTGTPARPPAIAPTPPSGPDNRVRPPTGRDPGTAAADTARQREIERVARLFAGGSRDALDAIESALEQYPDDEELTGWLTRVAARAQEDTARRQQSAVGEGATTAPSFSDAVQVQREALDLGQQGMTAAAVRKLWEAEELFAMALEWKADTSSTPVPTGRVKPAPETESAVRIPLSSLAQAYATLSAAAVKAAYPALTADQARVLDRSFLDYSAYRLDIRIVTATFRGERATVDCALDMTVTLRGGTERRSTTSATFVMESANGAWVISSASRLPN